MSTPLAEDKATEGTALLIIDMISDWDNADLTSLLEAAKAITPCIAALRKRCKAVGVPVIYVNDNLGRWRSNFKTLVQTAKDQGGDAAYIVEQLEPSEEDYFVLKPKYSAFFSTPLDLLLQHLDAHKLILCGVSGDQCVLATANDAIMRDYEAIVVSDGIASPTEARNRTVLQHFEEVMKTHLMASADIPLPDAKSS